MRIRIRSSNFRAPIVDGPDEPGFAFGSQDTTGRARATAATGGEAYGVQDTSGSAQPLLLSSGIQDTTGRASARILAFGRQDTIGSAKASGTVTVAYTKTHVLAAHPDLPTATLTDYTLQLHITDPDLRQAPDGFVIHPQAWDLRVQLLEGTALDHELETYDGDSGEIDINIRIPSWVSNAQYSFRLKFGSLT